MGLGAGDPEGAAWVRVQASLQVPTPPSVVLATFPSPTLGYRWRSWLRGAWGRTLGQPHTAQGACGAVSSDHQLEVRGEEQD